jgi:quercetin dioxygenase-like cupin family protein
LSRRLRASLSALLAVTALGAIAAVGYGDPSGLNVSPISLATLDGPVRLDTAGIEMHTRGARDALMARLEFAAHGTSGWHTHPGPVIVEVASGNLTLRYPTRTGCHEQTFGPGTGFIETGGQIHEAVAGDEPVTVYATFLAKPGTTSYLVPAEAPAACS